MSTEREGELPSGYTWRECGPIKAKFPMPQEWFFKELASRNTQNFFMSREQIQIKDEFLISSPGGGIDLKTTNPEGYFKTGLTVNVFFNTYKNLRRTASAMAGYFMEDPPKELIPTSQIIRQRDGNLIIYRRFFRSEIPVLRGIKMVPANYYVEFTANNRTDTAYHVMFETPSEKWGEDEAIARMMIENRVLDQST